MSNKVSTKICIYDKNTLKRDVLFGNGDYILDNICISCVSYENIDGTSELDATFITDSDGLYKNIKEESIIKVLLDYDYEIYRISKVTKYQNRIEIFARQITISETLDMWIEDIRPTNTSGLAALTDLKNNSIGKKDIEVFSDIDNSSTASKNERVSSYT